MAKKSVKKTKQSSDLKNVSPPSFSRNLSQELKNHVDILSKKLDSASKIHQDFIKCMDSLNSFSTESVNDIEANIREKEEEFYNTYDKISKEYSLKVYNLENEYKQKQYDLEQKFTETRDNMVRDFNNDEYSKAVLVLKNKDEIPVKKTDFDKLNMEIKSLKDNMENEILKNKKEVETKSKRELEAVIRIKELEFKTTSADMKAKIEQQTKEISNLLETIKTLKEEIKEQRELTRSVAQSSARPQIAQSIGK